MQGVAPDLMVLRDLAAMRVEAVGKEERPCFQARDPDTSSLIYTCVSCSVLLNSQAEWVDRNP